METLVKCDHMDLGYEHQDAVQDVTMEVDAGDYLCIVGANGAGKSTLVKGILGLLKPTGGSIYVSEDLKKSGIGYLPQQGAAQRDFPATVREVVLSGCLKRRGSRPFYGAEEKRLAAASMEKLGITDLQKKCYRELSGGQQQRALIARALCATNRLLILDEPITGLDPAAIMEFYGLIRRLNREDHVAVIMVTHDVRNMIREATKVLHLRRSVQFYGTAEEYRESAAGREFLGGGDIGGHK